MDDRGGVEIRTYRPDDAPALFDIFYSAVHGTAATYYTPAQIAAWAPAELGRDAWAAHLDTIAPFVAQIDGRAVGYADLQSDGYIDHFFVHGDFARRGIGNTLMHTLHQTARERALDRLYSNVSLAAVAFFDVWGFECVQAQTPIRRGVAIDNVRMRKRLGRTG
ncbi:acetyltransferase [Salinisphaera sp. S4-8]|uniref:GNAT family N-acetyltransferase n=1 Tax=Salinisphaera sp. S4-8 TaxID=633357 RepID=UPI0033404700